MKPRDVDSELTVEYLREVLHYNPLTGIFTYKKRSSQRMKIGAVAGSLRKDGYIDISIKSRLYLAHRLAWFHYYGKWPKDRIDHKRGKNNRITNLREATQQENMFNFNGRNRKDLSKGVFKCRDGKYQVSIRFKGKSIYLGRFLSEGLATEMYEAAASIIHRDFRYATGVKPRMGLVERAGTMLDYKIGPKYKPWRRFHGNEVCGK